MVLFGSTQSPDQIGYQTGCTDGKTGVSGLRVLFFGTQEIGGKLRPPGTTRQSRAPRVDQAAIEQASLGWVRGFTQCGTAQAVVAVATNNKNDGGLDGPGAGASWAGLVERIGASTPSGRVTVGGGLDGEPSWSDPGWARSWVDSFVKTSSRGLYVAGSADGCLTGRGEACNHDWTAQDVYHMSTGAGPNVYAVPQIYRTDGFTARQWAGISQIARMAGNPPVRFASVMTQQRACSQRQGCADIDNSPSSARDQLRRALLDPSNLDASKNVTRPAPPSGDSKGSDQGSGKSKGSDDSKSFDGTSLPNGTDTPAAPNGTSTPTVPPGTGTPVDLSKSSGPATFGSTDVAWPDDPSVLAFLTAQPNLPGSPTG